MTPSIDVYTISLNSFSHLLQDLYEFIDVLQLLDFDRVVFFDLIHQIVVNVILSLLGNKSHRDTVSSKSSGSSNPVEVVGVIWVFEAKLLDEWHLVIDDQIDFRDINSSRQHVRADQTGNVSFSKLIDDLVSNFRVCLANQLLCFYTHFAHLVLKVGCIHFLLNKNHGLVAVQLSVDIVHKLRLVLLVYNQTELLNTFKLESFCLQLEFTQLLEELSNLTLHSFIECG